MPFLSSERICDILRGITNAKSFEDVLDLLGAEIEALGLTDGYLINLLDASGKQLTCLKTRFPPEFQNLEQTYYGYKMPLDDGNLNARAMAGRETIHITHDNATTEEIKILRYWKVHESVGVPIGDPENAASSPIGAIVLLKQGNPVTERGFQELQSLLAMFYRSLANWLHYFHLEKMHDEATTAVEENQRLLQFLDEMNNLTSVDKIYDLFAAELFRQLPFDLAGFALKENDQLIFARAIVADRSLDGKCAAWERYMLDNPINLSVRAIGAAHVFFHNEPLVFPDILEIMHLPMDAHDVAGLSTLETARTLLLAPIRYQKKPIGILSLYTLGKTLMLSDGDRHMLDRLSSFLGTAITNGKIYATSQAQNLEIGHLNLKLQDKVRELAEQASTDQLTGLFNFRTFEKELEKRLHETSRASLQNELSLVLIDIDHFKHFNDTYGHAAGNDVLAGVAREIGRHIRQTDMACRYGGEEFVVILPKCDLEGARLLAERIRAGIEASIYDTCAGRQSVTVSIGCTMHQPGDTQQTVFSRADAALYQAKNQGRNQVCSG